MDGKRWKGKYIQYSPFQPSEQIIFEGEYIKGEINGKVKKYHINGKLQYEGEYLNGKKMEKEKNMIMMVNYNMKGNI